MECSELTEQAVGLLAGQSSASLRDELEAHCRQCPACRGELARIEGAWAALGEDQPARVTAELRERTLALMEDEILRQRIRAFRPRRPGNPGLRIAAQAAAVVLAAAVGWFAHRPSRTPPSDPLAAAGSPAGVSGTLSNVSYHPADSQGRVAVSFDVSSHRTVVGKPQDPEMANLVAYLVSRGAQTSGEKSQAIELVSSQYGTSTGPVSPEIVQALTTTLKKDQNPGVRKKAADALAGFPMTPEIRTAFLEALQGDRNPAVRLAAVDALAAAAKQTPDRRTIESLRERATDQSENGFVRAKAASALKAMEF